MKAFAVSAATLVIVSNCALSDADLIGTRCNRDGGCGPNLTSIPVNWPTCP
jgi:hypothetical protein